MKQTDARITELMSRLTALERERAEIVAEISTLRSARSEEPAGAKVVPSARAGDPIDRNSEIEKKDCSVSPAFPRPLRCLPHPLGESHNGTQRLRTCLCE
jgi:hypothetical protein